MPCFFCKKKKSLRYILEYSWSDKMPYEKGFIVFSPHPLYPTAFRLFLFWLEALCLALLFLMLVFPVWGFRPTAEGIKKVASIKTQLDYRMKNLNEKEFPLSSPEKLSFFHQRVGEGGKKSSKWISFHFHFNSLCLGVQYILSSQTLKEPEFEFNILGISAQADLTREDRRLNRCSLYGEIIFFFSQKLLIFHL